MFFNQFHRIILWPSKKIRRIITEHIICITFFTYVQDRSCKQIVCAILSIKNRENWYQKCSKFRKNRKSKKDFLMLPVNTILQEKQDIQIWQNSRLRKRKGQEGLWEVSKFRSRKSNKNFSCYLKTLSNKYGKNSNWNKIFNKILDLEREKVKTGFEKSANFAKVTRMFLPFWKYWVTNMPNLTMKFNKILDLEREKAKKGLEEAAI